MIFSRLLCACILSVCVLAQTRIRAENEVLIRSGDRWRYSAGESEADRDWLGAAYRALDWPLASTEYGCSDVELQPVESVRFHKVFTCARSEEVTALQIRLLRSDGAIVYLNGREIARSNVPPSDDSSRVQAILPALGPDLGSYHLIRAPANALRRGRNTLAVELHQAQRGSGEPRFDLELLASRARNPVFITRGPYLQNATPDAMTIRWRTDVPTVGVVRWGPTRQPLANTAPGPDGARTEHEIRLTGLTPATKYFYAIRSHGNTTRGNTATRRFKTLPTPGSDVPLRVWVVGDSGTGGDGTARAERVRDSFRKFSAGKPADIWLMLGDNAYNSGLDIEFQRAVFDTYRTFLPKLPLWSTLGNHETYGPEPIPYFNVFTLPTQGEAGGIPSGTEKYYSFDYGPVHFICLDSQGSNRQPGSPMLTWLDSDLAATQARWVIAFWHHPPYSRGSHNSDTEIELIEMRQNALPILEAYGVDLVLCGHSHSYERSMLIDGHYGLSTTLQPSMIKDAGSGAFNGDGPYVKAERSHGGAVYTVCGVSGRIGGGTFDHPVMVTSMATLGSMILDISGDRLNAKFLEATGRVRDKFTIQKP
jgi:hypothetical protein